MIHCWYSEVEGSWYSLAFTINDDRQYELMIDKDDNREQVVDKLRELAELIEAGGE